MLCAYAKTKAQISCVKVQISCVVAVYDQLRGLHAADQGLCICYIDITIPLLP